ncbi:V-type ATP synthase subunit E [Parasporobacterium paucivorans]|uniref:V/A-type H+-transporting ATPase subunit E n=1 Tax=Parasporobacterium paucivorans DSM 15970 TaxID=1122934 RepID=A0A1M6CQ06_9FIRM|nr:V-type ATP synthase subunit E family protein [Parasporobacterium paucivorans]SHI63175.1 V/A-type H+-transporting ATPase subunit E [Parasporobacterium paucivorans DSM 15970]
MTGLEKILEHIKSNADSEAGAVLEKAKKEVQQLLDESREEGAKQVKVLEEQSKTKYENLIKQGESAAALREKKAILETKQQAIEKVIEDAKAFLLELPEDKYFDTIVKMVKKYSLNQKGYLLFSESDLRRVPADFEAKLAEALKEKAGAELTVSKETRRIDGGFVLAYGEVEENCSFESLFSAAKETLQDKVGGMLFE